MSVSPRDRFGVAELWIDSGSVPLAAYQIKVTAKSKTVTWVGVEGGDASAFRHPPYYDSKAMRRNRIVLAAFSLKNPKDLPTGSYCIARLHIHVPANAKPEFETFVEAASNSEGGPLHIKPLLKLKFSQ